jgi:sugar lactone lactonase YvrE
MSDLKVELLVDSKSGTGEGPSWDARKNILYWVDIPNGLVHVYDAAKKKDRSITVGNYVSSIIPRAGDDDVVVTLQHGFYRLNLETGKTTKICGVEESMTDNRFNDGKCDTQGTYWAGTMGIKERKPTGALYRLDGSKAKKMVSEVTVSNGLGWSPDNSTMYYIDSPLRKVSAFDYDGDSKAISNRRTIVDYAKEEGQPDGMAVDSEGMIWVAHWGGFRITRWDPTTGKKLDVIQVPAQNVASCCFGGRKLDQLYITTATSGVSPDVLSKYPNTGGLFRVDCDVKGLPTNYFVGV